MSRYAWANWEGFFGISLVSPFPLPSFFCKFAAGLPFLARRPPGWHRYTQKTCSVPHCNGEVYPVQIFQMCKGKALRSAHTPQQAEAVWQEHSSNVTFPHTQTIFPSGFPSIPETILPFDTEFSSAQLQHALLVSTNGSKQVSLNTYKRQKCFRATDWSSLMAEEHLCGALYI